MTGFTAMTSAAQHFPGSDGMMGWSWGFGIVGILFWLALLALAIVLTVRLAQWRPGGSDSDSEGALEILKRRYASGEIDREEFESKKHDLGY